MQEASFSLGDSFLLDVFCDLGDGDGRGTKKHPRFGASAFVITEYNVRYIIISHIRWVVKSKFKSFSILFSRS